jgi:hypothetical protein
MSHRVSWHKTRRGRTGKTPRGKERPIGTSSTATPRREARSATEGGRELPPLPRLDKRVGPSWAKGRVREGEGLTL